MEENIPKRSTAEVWSRSRRDCPEAAADLKPVGGGEGVLSRWRRDLSKGASHTGVRARVHAP